MAAPALPTYETKVRTELPDHLTLEEAAPMLGRSTARLRQMVKAQNFQNVWELGDRPTYLLSRAEVLVMVSAQEAAADAKVADEAEA